MKNRTETEIIQNILSICKTKPYQDKLIRKSKISPQMFKKYEAILIWHNRITSRPINNRIVYQITKRGEQTLKSLIELHRRKTNILRALNITKTATKHKQAFQRINKEEARNNENTKIQNS